MYTRTTVVLTSLVAALGFTLVVTGEVAAAPTGGAAPALQERLAFPGLGERVLANGEPIEIEILPAQAGCTSDIYLLRPLATVPLRQHLGTNLEAGKRVVSNWAFARGEELQFEIAVHSSTSPPCGSWTFTSGPGLRNPDGLAHAWVTSAGRTAVTVAFEDVLGGGDWDFNDVVLKVRMATRSSGLDHVGLGGADLSTTENGEILVSHLSDSGQDGMGVSLGEARGWGFGLTSLEPSSAASTVSVTTRGRIGGVDNQAVATARFEVSQDGHLRVSSDFSALGAPTVRLDLRDEAGRSLGTIRGVPSGLFEDVCFYLPPPNPFPGMFDFHSFLARQVTGIVSLCCIDPWDFTEGTPDCGGPGGLSGEIASISIEPENPTRRPDFLSEAVLTAAGVSSLTVGGEALQFQPDGPFHRGLGGASLDAAGGALTVGGLGTSGEDGVAIDPGGPADSVGVVYSPFFPVPPPLPEGAFLELGARGVAGGAGDRDLGTVRLTAHEGAAEITADYSPVGSTSRRVLVLDDGEVVADVAGNTDAIRAGAWPTGARSGRFGVDGRPTRGSGGRFGLGAAPGWGFRFDFAADEAIEIPEGPTVVGDSVVVLAEAPAVPIGAISEVRIQGVQMPAFTLLDEDITPACTPGARSLCLHGGRFRVEVAWRTPRGTSGVGHALPLTDDTGTFWFFNPDNLELVVKALDACDFTDRFWVFAGGLTNVEVEMTVTDTLTGEVRRHRNPQRTPFAPILDTSAFATCGVSTRTADSSDASSSDGGAPVAARVGEEARTRVARDAASRSSSLLLNGRRFRVEAAWRTPDGRSGFGHAVQLTEDTGYFWFFDPENVELLVKALDACAFTDRLWIFAGGLTNVEVELTVTDMQTGEVRRYHNPQRTPFRPILDTSAFATCP